MWIIINDADWHSLISRLGVIHAQLTSIETHLPRMEKHIMSAMDTLRDDLHAYVASVNDFVTKVMAAIAAAQSASNDPAITALDGEVKTAAQQLADSAAGLNTPVAPPPA